MCTLSDMQSYIKVKIRAIFYIYLYNFILAVARLCDLDLFEVISC